MEPKLALSYSSQRGPGLLGVGWSLEGLSAVTRCPRTMAQDGVRGGVNYDANDRYCLDGQRLMAISGSYGADGTEYRTERESFTKVVSYGAAGNGPAWFKAWTKSGQIMEYGNTGDSRIEAQGKTSVRAWAVNKISDTKGNYFTLTYAEDNANGDFYPTRIDYSGNAGAGTSPTRSVQFVYQSRSDIALGYFAGSVSKTLNRLTNVRTFIATTQITDYVLAYDNLGAVGQSRLLSVTECATTCYPATTFASQTGGNGDFGTPNSAYMGSGGSPADRWFLMVDVNGDGKADEVRYEPSSGNVNVALSNGNGTFGSIQSSYLGTTGSPSDRWFTMADVNGDGKVDGVLFTPSTGYLSVVLSNGNGTFAASISTYIGSGGSPSDRWFTMSDVNGDGRADAVQYVPSDGHINVFLSRGDGTFNGSTSSYLGTNGSPSDRWFTMADVNGDGKPDAVLFVPSTGYLSVMLSNGDGFFGSITSTYIGSGGSPSDRWFLMSDVNGDGRADAVQYVPGDGYVNVFLSKGDGTFTGSTSTYLGTSGSPSDRWFTLADTNGDGKPDALLFTPSTGYVKAMLSKGDGTFVSAASTLIVAGGSPSDRWFVTADATGDGKDDAFIYVPGSGYLYTSIANGAAPDLLTSVTSGLGAVTTISHASIANSAVYAKDSSATYPAIDVQFPLYVAATVSAPNGIGGNVTTGYAYGGAKAELGTGRGFVGFRWKETTDQATGLKVRAEFKQDWPYVGLPSLGRSTQSSGAVLSQATHTYSCTNPASGAACTVAAGNRYFPFLSQSVETSNDLNGAALPTTTTTNSSFDLYGNVGTITVSTADGYSKTTTNTYANDTVNWFLGRLTRSTVQSTTP